MPSRKPPATSCVLARLPSPPTLRVADSEGRVACLVLVWDTSRPLPTTGAERRRRANGQRAGCKADVIGVLQAAARAAVSLSLIYAWCRTGVLKHSRFGLPGKRGCVRIAESDLLAFLAECGRTGQ